MNDNMSNENIVKELREMRASFQNIYDGIHRKRSWRESEKAMTRGKLARKMAALDAAIRKFETN
jgi:hypothetical protein